MTDRPIARFVAGILLASGAVWLSWMFWEASGLGYRIYGPPILGALFAGLTIGGIVERRAITSAAIVVAATSTIITILSLAIAPPVWVLASPTPEPPLVYYAIVDAASVVVAMLGASIPKLRRDPDHWLLWLWISALVTLGTMGLVILATDEGNGRVRSSAFFVISIFAAPFIAGAVTQIVALRRMIWVCGGGAVIFIVLITDRVLRQPYANYMALVAVAAAVFMLVLLGALGARIAWRVFRNADPPDPDPSYLPPARTR